MLSFFLVYKAILDDKSNVRSGLWKTGAHISRLASSPYFEKGKEILYPFVLQVDTPGGSWKRLANGAKYST